MKGTRLLALILLFAVLLSLAAFLKADARTSEKLTVYFFWGQGCPHCEKEKPFLDELQKTYPELEIRRYEVWYNTENARFFEQVIKSAGFKVAAVPITFIDDIAYIGFSENKKHDMEEKIRFCLEHGCSDMIESAAKAYGIDNQMAVDLPFFGKVDSTNMALPIFTIAIAALDSFNPCAFSVFFFLLSLLIHARSRKRMFLIGGIFVFFSGTIYFLFMAAWLNIFLIIGRVVLITLIAGIIALTVALLNIKDFFFFRKGFSLSIPESAKPGLFDRMRGLIKSTSLLSIITGTVVLAIAANFYELRCTAGFPMVFTRILTLHQLVAQYYFYLILYNIIYIIPLTLIVMVFTITLGSKKLTEWEGRKLKLISGLMMFGLGTVLLVRTSLLNNIIMAIGLFLAAVAASVVIISITKRLNPDIANP